MERPILLYDGFCVLCSWSVQWLIKRDRRQVFRFIPLQSEEGKRLLSLAPPAVEEYLSQQNAATVAGAEPETVILWMDHKPYLRSDAILLSVAQLGGVYRMATWLRVIPRPLRDGLYRFIGKHRYRWFGRKDQCWLPPGDGERRTEN